MKKIRCSIPNSHDSISLVHFGSGGHSWSNQPGRQSHMTPTWLPKAFLLQDKGMNEWFSEKKGVYWADFSQTQTTPH